MTEPDIRNSELNPAFDRLPLNALRVFEAVATRLSFADAAEALNVTPAAVSMQIRGLEEYVQVPLFKRSGRRVDLTPEGAQLLPGVRRGLAELQQAMQQLRRSRSSGPLQVTTIASLLQKWLLPRLPQFYERHPDIDLRLHTSRRPVDFAEDEFHVAVRMSRGPTPGLYNEKLLDEWFVVVANPSLYRRHGPVRSAADLKRYPLLRSSDETWSHWTEPAEQRDWVEHGGAFDDSLTVLAAAEQGQGLALTRWSIAARDIDSGRVVLASPRIVTCPRAYYFVCPESHLLMPKVIQWRDWLRQMASEFPPPPGSAATPPPLPRAGKLRRSAKLR
jgi:LysR family transcriptional regulator, glycine cleavage system transcriptional activator